MAKYKAQAEDELEAAIAATTEAAQKYVVIKQSSAFIRTSPNTTYGRIKTGLQGESYPYLGEESVWYKIDVDGRTGYVHIGMCKIE